MGSEILPYPHHRLLKENFLGEGDKGEMIPHFHESENYLVEEFTGASS